MSKPLYEEIIDEIGTQTLARLGLNIFSLDTYNAYGESVTMSNEASRVYNQHKNNPQGFGQYFEELDIGMENIKSAFFNKGEKTYTTDTLFEIQKIQNLQQSSKKIENLNPKDKAKFDFIMQNYSDEVKNMDFNSPDIQALIQSDTREGTGKALKNHTNTDTVTFDKNGKITNKAQLKVIKNTSDLLQNRYLQNNDELRMPFDDYKRHKENLEKMQKDPKISPQDKQNAQKALEMLNKNNFANRLLCENPRTTAVITQSAVASAHIAQAGASDAVVVALSTLASGAVYEIKDALSGNSSTSIETRIKRLINAVIKSLKDAKGAFVRGAGFGGIDVIIGILGQIFNSIAGKLKVVWKELRNAAKSIYNAIYEYIKGKISSFEKLLSVIIKGLFSAVVVVASVGFESKLEAALAPLITPFVASFVAPSLAIIVGSITLVMMSKSIDLALETLFGVFAQAEISKKRYEEIATLCEQILPELIENRQMLEERLKKAHCERMMSIEASFSEYESAVQSGKLGSEYLNEICKLFKGELKCKNLDDLKEILNDNKGLLRW